MYEYKVTLNGKTLKKFHKGLEFTARRYCMCHPNSCLWKRINGNWYMIGTASEV